MCGICGYTTDKPSEEQRKYLKCLLPNLLLETSNRGVDATGYLAFFPTLQQTIQCKRPLRAEKFILTGLLNFKYFPSSILLHARAATSGKAIHNENNHPFTYKDFGIVHNGVVRGWDTFPEYEPLRKEMVSLTDSELFGIYLQQHSLDMHDLPIFFSCADYALGIMKFKKGDILLLRNTSPLVIADLRKPLNAIVFASAENIIDRAIANTFKTFPQYIVEEIEPYTVYSLSKTVKKSYACNKPKVEDYSQYLQKGKFVYPYSETGNDYYKRKYYYNNGTWVKTHYTNPLRVRIETKVLKYLNEVLPEDSKSKVIDEFASKYYADNNWQTRTTEESLLLVEDYICRYYDDCAFNYGGYND